MDHPGRVTKETLKEVLKTQDGKVVGGSLTSITRKAKRFNVPQVLAKEGDKYEISDEFRKIYEESGSPNL